MNVETENTFNRLANKPLIATGFLCRFGFHKWQKWSDMKEGTKPGYMHKKVQERYCYHCNKFSQKVLENII